MCGGAKGAKKCSCNLAKPDRGLNFFKQGGYVLLVPKV
jgi:hypothetical protein